MRQDFPGGSDGKASVYSVRDLGLIPGLGRFPGEGNGNPLQYSCLETLMDGGAWWATVHGVSKSQTRLSDFTSLHFKSIITVFAIKGNASLLLTVRKKMAALEACTYSSSVHQFHV